LLEKDGLGARHSVEATTIMTRVTLG